MGNVPKSLDHKEIINCKPVGKYIGNDRCHVNCLSYALRNPKKVKHIIGVAQVFNNNNCVAHFIIELHDGTYIDRLMVICQSIYIVIVCLLRNTLLILLTLIENCRISRIIYFLFNLCIINYFVPIHIKELSWNLKNHIIQNSIRVTYG